MGRLLQIQLECYRKPSQDVECHPHPGHISATTLDGHRRKSRPGQAGLHVSQRYRGAQPCSRIPLHRERPQTGKNTVG